MAPLLSELLWNDKRSALPSGYKSSPHDGKFSVSYTIVSQLLTVPCTTSPRYYAIHFGVAQIFTITQFCIFTATEEAWTTPFRGNGAALFRLELDRMNEDRGEKLYANFVPIIQSSGMGKSRLVDETAKLVFTLPFCFRSESDGQCTLLRRHLQHANASLQATHRRI